MSWEVITGDCIEEMRKLEEGSVDAVVTDPPYGLEFMGQDWDRFQSSGEAWSRKDTRSPDWNGREVHRQATAYPRSTKKRCRACGKQEFSGSPCVCSEPEWETIASAPVQLRAFQSWCEAWAVEALRVLKPGGHLLAFGGTRTYHRLACAIEDAGFEIRDSIMWIYGSGFPKSSSPYRRVSPCPSIESAPHAARLSEWLPLASSEGRAPTALALVETQPEGELAIAIQTGKAGASPALTVTSLSDFLTATTSSSIAWSWSECSGAPWNPASRSTIETAIKAITDPRTWRSSALPPTPGTTTQDASSPAGCECHVATVASRSSVGRWSLNDTRRHIAIEPVTSPLAALRPLGTALKPSHEPIVVARKPLIGTVAENVLEHGTGGLNIDACRIGTSGGTAGSPKGDRPSIALTGGAEGRLNGERPGELVPGLGRWPPNVILDEEAAAELDAQSGELTSGRLEPHHASCGRSKNKVTFGKYAGRSPTGEFGGDSGGASRFFLTVPADTLCHLCNLPCVESAVIRLSPSGPRSATAQDSAPDEPARERGASAPNSTSPAGTAAPASRTTQPIDPMAASSALPDVPEQLAEWIVRLASDAVSLCEPCATNTAQSVARLLIGQTPDSLPGAASTSERRGRILSQNLALVAAGARSTGIIPTIESLSALNGFAAPATTRSTQENDAATPTDQARFRYQSKTSRAERNAGLEGFPELKSADDGYGSIQQPKLDRAAPRENWDPHKSANHHPTVKPINLGRHLERLVTPPGGIVLDPFAGSGSFGCSAVLEGFHFIGIEREPEYVEIMEARIAFWAQHEGREVEDVLQLYSKSTKATKAHEENGQGSLLALATSTEEEGVG